MNITSQDLFSVFICSGGSQVRPSPAKLQVRPRRSIFDHFVFLFRSSDMNMTFFVAIPSKTCTLRSVPQFTPPFFCFWGFFGFWGFFLFLGFWVFCFCFFVFFLFLFFVLGLGFLPFRVGRGPEGPLL